jgi:hypothetical protein
MALTRPLYPWLMRRLGSRLANSKIISSLPISPYANHETCFKLARNWRDTCLEKHGKSCVKLTKRSLPNVKKWMDCLESLLGYKVTIRDRLK